MKILSKINKKNKELIIESLFFIIVSSLIYLYVRKNNKDNKIDQYYMFESNILYNLFKISSIIIQLTLIFNIKFIFLIILKSYIL